MTEYNDPLTGTVKEKYTTGSGKHGLIIDCDNPNFNHGANVKPDQERVVSNGSENKYNNYLSEIAEAYEAIENFPIIQNLDQENKRAIAISAVINQMRNGR